MFSSTLTIVIGYRNREIERIKRCLDSLLRQTNRDFNVIFVDYGSSIKIANPVQNLLETSYPFCQYIYSDTRGYPWSRSKALNIGLKKAASEYVLSTDVDMVFAENFVATILENVRPTKVINCAPHWLPKKFDDWSNVSEYIGRFRIGDQAQLGGCQCFFTKSVQEIRGFDEYYQYWGLEDHDLHHRLGVLNIDSVWVTKQTAMFHQWHQTNDSETSYFFPLGLWGEMANYERKNRQKPIRNSENWGSVVSANQRPVFRFLDTQNNTVSDTVQIFSFSPEINRSIGKFIDRFWDLPSGSAIAIDYAGYPNQYLILNWLIKLMNYFFKKLNLGSGLQYKPNLLHSYITKFIDEYPDHIVDYYLDFPTLNGTSVLVRA